MEYLSSIVFNTVILKNKNIKMSFGFKSGICLLVAPVPVHCFSITSFKSSENIRKNEGGPDRSVLDNQSSSDTLNELAMKARIIL